MRAGRAALAAPYLALAADVSAPESLCSSEVRMVLVYVGGAIALVWGVAHVASTRPALAGFTTLSVDNRRVLLMEWLAAGLALCFIGLLVILVGALAPPADAIRLVVHRASGIMLLVLAGLSALTGARTPPLPFKLCPFIEGTAGVLVLLGARGA